MTAISMAKVVTDKGVFIECGDANPGNVDTKIIPHIIRMSVTRAKSRAMRDAVNIGALSLEEMAEEFGNGSGNGNGSGDGMPSHTSPQSEVRFMTPEQRKFLFKLLAEKGVAADDGHAWLCKAAIVEDVKFITKKQASELIDHLRKETSIPKPQQTEEGKVSRLTCMTHTNSGSFGHRMSGFRTSNRFMSLPATDVWGQVRIRET
ncbi:MAG: hypothetical protein IPH75_14820 [bacterium]|nr:hypothetical protein [bacterium]